MEDWKFITIICVVGALAVAGVVAEQIQWQEFSRAHDCKVVGKISPSSGTGFDAKGNTTYVSVPGKTGYQCDDGVTYWR